MADETTDPVCECGVVFSRHNAFFFRCKNFRLPYTVDMRAENAAARAGANAAATKRARGQDLMPKLHLKGSKPRRRQRCEESVA